MAVQEVVVSTGTEERVVVEKDVLADSDIVHLDCCRRRGEMSFCGLDLTNEEEVDADADCVVCVDLARNMVRVMRLFMRNHTHCPIDRMCCPPPRSDGRA